MTQSDNTPSDQVRFHHTVQTTNQTPTTEARACSTLQDDPTPLEWMFYFGFWVLAGIIFAVKLRRGTLIHAESRKQRLDRERAASMTPLLCEQCGKQTTPTESEATPSEVRGSRLRAHTLQTEA